MFALNDSIAQWRRRLRGNGLCRRRDLDELESHLRDEIEHLAHGGLSEEDAFRHAALRLGEPETLRKEFAKARGPVRAGLEYVAGGALAMIDDDRERGVYFARWMLWAGGGALAAWLVTFGRIMAKSSPNPAQNDPSDWMILWTWAISWLFLLGGPGILWGLWTLGKRKFAKKALLGTVLLAAALLPLYFLAGMNALLLTPTVYGAAIPGSGRLVQSLASPDGRFEAYVIDRPCIDGPDQHLFIRENGAGGRAKTHEVGHLMGDMDALKQIHWSPKGDMVVFSNFCTLFAVKVPGLESARTQFGYVLTRKEGKYKYKGCPPPVVEAISFPEPGCFAYRFAGEKEDKKVGPGAFARREAHFLVCESEENQNGAGNGAQ